MNIGFSTLSLFMKPINEMYNIAKRDGFKSIELLSEGPYIYYNLNKNKEVLNNINRQNIKTYLHCPTVDLNLASINEGIKKESVKQTCKTLDLAEKLDVIAITTHCGKIGRNDKHLRKEAINNCVESINTCMNYIDDNDINVNLSIENLPKRFNYLGNKTEELEYIQENTGCQITIDTGHANTCENTSEFFELNNIIYYHIHDNNGIKDQHLILGEGNLDLDLLKNIENGIIELNTYEKVLKTKSILENLNLI